MGRNEKYDFSTLPLGKMTDRAIADRFGIPLSSVSSARRRRGIKAYNSNKKVLTKEEWLALPLGKMPDAEIARNLGCPAATVNGARRRLGIPSYTAPGRSRPKRSTVSIDWDNEPRLGQMSDRQLARLLGLRTGSAVARQRMLRGIPPYKLRTATELDRELRLLQTKWNDIASVRRRLEELKKA